MCDLKRCGKKFFLPKVVSVIVLLNFLFFTIIPPGYAQSIQLPSVGALVPLSPTFQPAILRGIQVDPFKHLELSFIVDAGESGLTGQKLQDETNELVHYFLASLAIPEEDLWVNLSPYENDRVVPDALGKTEMGRDLLAQDYMLKQVTASLLYPDDELGKQFWQRVYKKAYEQYGTTNIPINTFNKVWILPDTVKIYEENDRAIITEAKMKVMLEEDYLAKEKNLKPDAEGKADETAKLSSEIIREIVIPEIEKEINEGKNFAKVRQIYYSLVLAHWFKTKLKNVLLNKIFTDLSKTKGFESKNPEVIDKIFDQYVESFKKGVCNILRIDFDENEKKHVPRKYFSGGASLVIPPSAMKPATGASASAILNKAVKAAVLFTAVFLFNLSVTGKAETMIPSQDANGDANTSINFEATVPSAPNVYAVNAEFTEGPEGPPDLNSEGGETFGNNSTQTGQQGPQSKPTVTPQQQTPPSGQVFVQMFGKTVPALAGGIIVQSANNPNANFIITNIHQTTVHNSLTKQDVPVNVFEAEVTVNGVKYISYGSELQSPNPGFNYGHMTASHVYQALINSFPAMAAGITQAMGMTNEADALKELEKQYASVRVGGQINSSDPAFINTNDPFNMSVGAVYFVVTSDGRRVPVLIDPLKMLDPSPITNPFITSKLIPKYVDLIFVNSENHVSVSVDGRTMSTVHGQEGKNFVQLFPTIKNFAKDFNDGNVADYRNKGIDFFGNLGLIDQAAQGVSNTGESLISDAQVTAGNLVKEGTIQYEILNRIFPDFLERIDQHAQELTASLRAGVQNGQEGAQTEYDRLSKEELVLIYGGFLFNIFNNEGLQDQMKDFGQQAKANFSVNSKDGSVSAGTNAQAGEIATQAENASFEVSFKGEDGKTKKVHLSLGQVASLRYAMSVGLGVNAQGSIALDENTQTLFVEIFNQFQGTNFQNLANTDYYDLGDYYRSFLGPLFNDLYQSPSQAGLEAGIGFNGFAGAMVSGLRTFSAEAGVELEVKGIPVVVNAFGGVGGYAVFNADLYINGQGGLQVDLHQQGSDVSGQADLTVGGQAGASVSGKTETAVHGGVQVSIPSEKTTVLVNLNQVNSQDLSAYANVSGKAGVTVKDGILDFSLDFTSEVAGRDLTRNHVSYDAGEINLNDIFSDFPTMTENLDEWARGQAAPNFLVYLQNNLDVPSAWNNFMPGSGNLMEGLNNFIEGMDTQSGLDNVFDEIRTAFVDSGNLALWQEFEAKISERLNQIQEDIRQQLSQNQEKFAHNLVSQMESTRITFQFLKEWDLLEGNDLINAQGLLDFSLGVPGAGLRMSPSVQGHRGRWNAGASVEFGLTDQFYVRLRNLGIGFNMTPGDFSRMMSRINLIQSMTSKKMTPFGIVEDIRKAVDQNLYTMDTTNRVKAMGLMILNPQMRQLYNLNIDPNELTGFAMAKAVYQNRRGNLAGSVSFETLISRLQGTRRYQSYMEFALKMKLDQAETNQFIGFSLVADPAFGIVGGGVTLEANKVNFDMRINRVPSGAQGNVFQLGVRADFDNIINLIRGKKGKVRVAHYDHGAEVDILDARGNPNASGYVPYGGQQAEEIGNLILDGKDEQAAEEAIDLLIKQATEEQAIEEAEGSKTESNGIEGIQGSEGVNSAEGKEDNINNSEAAGSQSKEENVGGIAFDSRKINMEIEGGGIEFDFPDTLITDDMRNLMGLVPEIINFVPITNPISLFGPLAKVDQKNL
ncbi:MAG: hypothetical protein P9M07_06030 [Candidatus Aceula meridiana]|nr:hypothetical protein [Candidatus Aceula meridiana]